MIARLLRRWLNVPETADNTVQIPDEVVSALRATPGGSLRIYFVVVPFQQENVTWWLDGSAEGVKQ